MKQITISIPDEKYSSFLELINNLEYVHLEEDVFQISEAQIKYVLDIKANSKPDEMIDSEELFKKLDKYFS